MFAFEEEADHTFRMVLDELWLLAHVIITDVRARTCRSPTGRGASPHPKDEHLRCVLNGMCP